MKSEKEPNELKKQYEELSEKYRELTPEELAQVTGGWEGNRAYSHGGGLYMPEDTIKS